jgi:hypothetical protein
VIVTERNLKDDELALVFTPGEGLRLELPIDELPIGIDGAVLAVIYMRLRQDGDWAEELRRWTMTAVPGMQIN